MKKARSGNKSSPAAHPAVLLKLVKSVGVEGKTICLRQIEGRAMTRRDANNYKWKFYNFLAALRASVKAGERKHERLLAEAEMVCATLETIKSANGKSGPDDLVSLSFRNRNRTTFAATMEAALADLEEIE